MNLPDYTVLPAPLWLFTVLHVLTLTMHFAAMNFLFGGVVTVIFGKITNRWSNPAVRRMVGLFPTAMAATISFAIAPLLFVQVVYGRQMYAASIISGWFWMMIVVAALISYYFLYGAASSKASNLRISVSLAIALVGFIYISFVHSSVFSLAERPDLQWMLYAANQSGLILNPDIDSYLFRWLHMITGAVTVGAFFTGWIGRNDEQTYAAGKVFFLWGMATASITGLVYLISFGEELIPFMRSPAIWWLLVSIILSLGSLHFFFKKKFLPAASMLMVSLLGMVVIRHYVRLIRLDEYFDPSQLAVNPQWLVIAIFAVCFLLAIGVIWYMITLFLKQSQSARD